MSLQTKVKAGNITNLHDARYCAGMGVDWLGFRADTVDAVTFKEITHWVSGPQFVLELSERTSIDSIALYPVSVFEISHRQLNLIDQLPHGKWIVKLPLSAWNADKNELVKQKEKISHLVIDLDVPDAEQLLDVSAHFKILVHQHIAFSLKEVLALPVDGISVGMKSEPGYFETLAVVLEELEVMD